MKEKIFCNTFSLTREWNLYLIDFLAFHMLALQWLAPCKNSVKWLTEAEMALADYPIMSLIFGSEIQISWVGRPTKMAHALWGRRLCKLPREPAPPLHRSSHGAPSRTEEHFWSEKEQRNITPELPSHISPQARGRALLWQRLDSLGTAEPKFDILIFLMGKEGILWNFFLSWLQVFNKIFTRYQKGFNKKCQSAGYQDSMMGQHVHMPPPPISEKLLKIDALA